MIHLLVFIIEGKKKKRKQIGNPLSPYLQNEGIAL